MIELATKTDIQTLTFKETEYVVITKKEYIELLEKIEDLEDVILINEAKLNDTGKGYSMNEVRELFNKRDNGLLTDKDIENL